MKEWIISRAMGLVLPVVLGPIAYAVTQWLKKWLAPSSAAIDFLSHCVTTKAIGPSTTGRNSPVAREMNHSFI